VSVYHTVQVIFGYFITKFSHIIYLTDQCSNLSVIDHTIKIIKGLMTSVRILISMHPSNVWFC